MIVDAFLTLKFLHVIGAAVLLGTGAGIAFFMVRAHRTGNPAIVTAVAEIVVLADFLFTATAVIAQPVTGLLLVQVAGYSIWDDWIVLSIVLYLVTGAFCACATSRQRRHVRETHFPRPITGSTGCGSRSAFRPSQRRSPFSG